MKTFMKFPEQENIIGIIEDASIVDTKIQLIIRMNLKTSHFFSLTSLTLRPLHLSVEMEW